MGTDLGESNNVYDQYEEQGMSLKSELENWLELTKANIPQIDPLYNEEQEKKWLNQHKENTKIKVEERRKFQLASDYLPNDDWWGSTKD